jgi:hypothetical protein
MTASCEIRVVRDRVEWDELFGQVQLPHLVQSWAYGDAKLDSGDHSARRSLIDAGGWRPRRVVFTRDGEAVAICQFMDKPVATFAAASRVNRGPLLLGRPDAETIRAVYAALKSRRRRRCGVLVLAPALEDSEENVRLLATLGFRRRDRAGWISTRLDLDRSPEELRANLHQKWRNRLNTGERAGFTFRAAPGAEGLEWMVARHIENMQDKGFAGPSPALLRALYRAAPDSVLVFQACLDGQPAGGMLVYRFGAGAEYYVGWIGAEGKRRMAGNFLYWNVAVEMQRRGCRWIDLGGERPGHTEHFKRGMRGDEYQLLGEWLAV